MICIVHLPFYLCKTLSLEKCLKSFTLGVFFLDSHIKHFSVSLRLFKMYMYVADQRPTISFFPIYTKLCYRKRGLIDKLKHKLFKC